MLAKKSEERLLPLGVKLKRRSGFLYTALYLKQCTVSLQRYYAGCYSKNDTMSVPVSLTRCGIPKIIPAVLRKHVRAKPDHGDYLVRIYLSCFVHQAGQSETTKQLEVLAHLLGVHLI
ncbi:hypothetical protein KY290_031048 [Solanum tuberosum]|uniref:Uncharacterized protein n=1 Tax=Solanum tuberosum TaxID=4113 RepID=A0ABQ7U880_SOLTU|nr:hypothetical protein KY290_031048 [Solanum tuberosum]